jgi:transcriptional regulator with XRE-family HTH domain
VDGLSQKAGVSHNAISRIERDAIKRPNIKVLGRLLSFFSGELSEAFPEGDPYDHIIPPKSFGSWIQNQRLRRAMGLHEFARLMRVHVYSTIRYESDVFRPNAPVQRRLREVFGEGIDRFLKRATISKGADGCPVSAGSRTRRSRRHAQKKQASAAVPQRKTRVRILG